MILKGFTDSFEFHLLIDFETRSYYASWKPLCELGWFQTYKGPSASTCKVLGGTKELCHYAWPARFLEETHTCKKLRQVIFLCGKFQYGSVLIFLNY